MKTKFFTLLLSMVFFGTYAFAQDCATSTPPMIGDECIFDMNGNFTVPAGYSVSITVTAWGGGGGGSRGGGGGGAYATNTYSNIPAGDYAITVGQQVAQATAGNPSSYTFLAGTVTAGGGAAGGGAGASNAAGGMLDGGSGSGSKAGGNGGNATGNGGGGGGGAGPASGNGVNGGGSGGAGGAPNGGGGGNNSSPGSTGIAPGGGGGGGGGNSNIGGTGAAGLVTVQVLAVLPVELLSFTGKATPKNIQLNWQTGTELNNEKFVIERSTDGRTFQVIGEERGQGTTQQTQAYQFTDQTPVAGLNYYRLKQMDYDGQFAYSPVTAITFTRKGAISVYPTATNGMVNIVTEDEGSSLVKVFHINGSLMKQQTFDGSSLPLDISSLPNGTYLVVVETSTQTYQERIFKY